MSVKSILKPVLGILMVLFTQCTKETIVPVNKDLNGAQELRLKAGELETVTNNLSFPVIATDGFSLTGIADNFGTVYSGTFPGLTDEQIAAISGEEWYAQKVENNKWQADFLNSTENVFVDFIDWGDMMESVNAKVGHPFRIELGLYVNVSKQNPRMKGFTMTVLENPSSSTELQGTDQSPYDAIWATVASPKIGLAIQKLETGFVPAKWNVDKKVWEAATVIRSVSGSVSASASQGKPTYGFAMELNVAGKYIYGTTSGGWRPSATGKYRITFYLDPSSNIHLQNAIIGNYVENSETPGPIETKAGKPVVDNVNNLTYVDINVVNGSGSGSGGIGSGSAGRGSGQGGFGSAGKGGMNMGNGGRH